MSCQVETKKIEISKTGTPKEKPDFTNLGFGENFTDHMVIMDYSHGKWNNPRIEPLREMSFMPSAIVLHYGQAVFEGMKAFKSQGNDVLLFRPDENMSRLNLSSSRMEIPTLDEECALEAIKTLVNIDRDWVPDQEGTSLYIRPFIIASDSFLGIKPSSTYKFIVIACPVGAYYKEGVNPVKIYVETEYVRAVRGGVGYAKTPGNYAASLKSQVEAQKKGYTQVLWLDAIERKYVEEVGTMNVFFRINDEIVTPSLEGSILPGITRDTAITLLKDWGIKIIERKISIEELYESHANGTLKEAFGTGTAAVISPIGELVWGNRAINLGNGGIGEISQRLYNTITGIQTGKILDTYGWTIKVPE